MGNLSKGEPKTEDLPAAVSPKEAPAILLPPKPEPPLPKDAEFHTSAPGQQMAMVCRTELRARANAWCWGHVLY